jgi:hypothetical protein
LLQEIAIRQWENDSTFLALSFVHRDLIIKLATDYRLPAVHPNRVFVAAGGLISLELVRVRHRNTYLLVRV